MLAGRLGLTQLAPRNEPHRVLGRAWDPQAPPETVLPAPAALPMLLACAVEVAQLSLVVRLPEPHTHRATSTNDGGPDDAPHARSPA